MEFPEGEEFQASRMSPPGRLPTSGKGTVEDPKVDRLYIIHLFILTEFLDYLAV
jgi:hypothetical protein